MTEGGTYAYGASAASSPTGAVIVTSPTGLVAAIAAVNTAGGGTILLLKGTTYTVDMTTLPAVVENIHFTSNAVPGDDLTEGAIWNVTKGVVTPDSVVFQECEFDHISFTSADTTLNATFLGGFTGHDNFFHDNLWYDFAPWICYRHGVNFRAKRNKTRTSGSPPAHVNCGIIAPLSMDVRDNDFDHNVSTMQGNNNGIVVGGAGALMAGQSFGDWVVENNVFFMSNQAGHALDTFFDCESDQALLAPNCIVKNNRGLNAKLAFSSPARMVMDGNIVHITVNALAQTNAGAGILQFATGSSGMAMDDLTIINNVVIQDDVVPTGGTKWDWRCIVLNPPNGTLAGRMGRFVVRGNFVIANGKAGVPANNAGPITLTIPNTGTFGAAAALTVDFSDISDNVVAMSSVPGATPSCAIVIADLSSIGAFTKIRVVGNRVMGTTPAGPVYPATAAGAFTNLLRIGVAAKTMTWTNLEVTDNLCEDAGLTVPTATVPFLITTSGTIAATTGKFVYSRNSPRLSNMVVGATAQTNPVVSLLVPTGFPDLEIRLSGHVNITTLGSGNFQLQDVYVPETAGASQTAPLVMTAPTSSVLAVNINVAGSSSAVVEVFRVKANGQTVKIMTSAATYTGCTYNVDGEIEIL